MRNQPILLGTLTIASGGTASGAIEVGDKPIRSLVIAAPAALTGVVSVQVSLDAGVTWKYLTSGGADIQIAAARCVVVDCVGYDQVRVFSSAAEGGARAFVLKVVEEF
jgi:hypothetical protein